MGRDRASRRAVHESRPLKGQLESRSEHLAPPRGLGDHRVAPLVRQGAGRLCAPLCTAGARRLPRSPRLRRGDGHGRAQRRHGQPARPRRGGRDRVRRELPWAAARVRARRAGDGRRRAREHLGAAHREDGEPEPLGRPPALPRGGGRAELRLHDPAVRRSSARLREQGLRAPGERRLDPDERRTGGSCVDGEHRRI